MKQHAQSVDDALIGGLNYTLKAGAPYVANRRSVTYFAAGGNQSSSSGVTVMEFPLSGDQWLDPSTFQVMLQIKNKDGTKPLRAVHYDPAVIFSRMRIIAGGVVCEDISDANKLSVMLDALSSEDEQTNRKTIGLSTLIATNTTKH